MKMYSQMHHSEVDTRTRRRELTSRLERVKKLYTWGDLTDGEYMAERRQIQLEPDRLSETTSDAAVLKKLANFLSNVGEAWEEAHPERRN